MDGKHVIIQAPIHSGSDYFNYKGSFSIVLFAVVDSQYCFTYVSVGCQGRLSDGGVFGHSNLNKLLIESQLGVPNPTPLPGLTMPVPYVLLADDAFPLRPNIMKPFPGLHNKGSPKRVYNYRHCRGRRVVENVFGIASVVFRVLRKPLLLQPENAEKIVLACAHLHNFLRQSHLSQKSYNPPGSFDREDTATGTLVPGQWRVDGMPTGTLLRLQRIPKKSSSLSKEIREQFTAYFNSAEGAVTWQNDH